MDARVGASPEKGPCLRQVRCDQQEVVHQAQQHPTTGQRGRGCSNGPKVRGT